MPSSLSMQRLTTAFVYFIVVGHCFIPRKIQQPQQRFDLALQDISSSVVSAIMSSPLYGPIVSVARNTMIKSAISVGVDWEGNYSSTINAADWQERISQVISENPKIRPPSYYLKKFHGYTDGNLCIDAAIEQELAGKAVGARNFPNDGFNGEEILRGLYDTNLKDLGAVLPDDGTIVDFGCGTGTSTRRLATLFPNAKQIIGFDLSPQMIAVGRYLLNEGGNQWVTPINKDSRVSLCYGDVSTTGLPTGSVGLVSICLTLHELPQEATDAVLREAHRILSPGGTLAIMEMDPEAPGYRKLRAAPWLFAILRSTEPWLDEYFDLAPSLPTMLSNIGFSIVRTAAATGRHLVIVALKEGLMDYRPVDSIREKSDQHVATLVKKIS